MKKNLKLLISETREWLASHHFSPKRIKIYDTLWRLHLLPYMESYNHSVYSPEMGREFINTCHKDRNLSIHARLERERCVRLLDDMLAYGEVRSHRQKKLPPLYGKIGNEMCEFLDFLRSERRSKNTIDGHHRFLLHFLNYLTDKGIACLSDITSSILFDYFSNEMPSKKHCLLTIRYIFHHWYSFGKIDGALLKVFDMIKVPEKEKLVSVYEEDEIAQIVKSVKHSDPLGKRNYAILLLAVYYGLRASDIAALSFEHIKWDKDLIEFYMVKTGKFLSLPLRVEVGNVLVDYIKNSRPNKVKSSHLFLSLVAPYNAMTNKGIATTLRQIISKSGVDTSKRHSGAHIFRHSLASNMLRKSEAYSTISESLGHSYTPTTMEYLRIDITSLMKCALEVPPVNKDFYQQKGGIFYEP